MRVVYVARGLSTGLYKIGITHYPPERVRSLAAWLQEPVEMLAGFPGEVPDERADGHVDLVEVARIEAAAWAMKGEAACMLSQCVEIRVRLGAR